MWRARRTLYFVSSRFVDIGCKWHLSHDLDVSSAGTIFWSNGIDDLEDVALHHSDIVFVAFSMRHFAKVFDEVHDVGSDVHVILDDVSRGAHISSASAHTFSSCSNMQECKSSPISLYFRA